jgi:hypothetical protein
MAEDFSVERAAVKSILDGELGWRKFTRRWVPHILWVEQIEKSDVIPKSVDHPGKLCGEKHLGDHYKVLKKLRERFRKHGVRTLSKTSKMSSSLGWSDQLG